MNGLARVLREARRYERKVEEIRPSERRAPLVYLSAEPFAGWAWLSGGVTRDGDGSSRIEQDRIYIEFTARGAVTYARRATDNRVFQGSSFVSGEGWFSTADMVIRMIQGKI